MAQAIDYLIASIRLGEPLCQIILGHSQDEIIKAAEAELDHFYKTHSGRLSTELLPEFRDLLK
jgi:hypothetical protein